jgi:hypothetical protein
MTDDDQLLLFDASESQRRKQEGMDLATLHRGELLNYLRELAEDIARNSSTRTCSIDEVFRRVIPKGFRPEMLGNAAGSLFKYGKWELMGRKNSKRISNHAREIKVWRLKRPAS